MTPVLRLSDLAATIQPPFHFDVPGLSHLQRLDWTWKKQPIYFITTCVAKRRRLLATPVNHSVLCEEWAGLKGRHGWAVGRYVIMPDHVHFFITPTSTPIKTLSQTIGIWKEWTSKKILKATGETTPLWQPEFFDHLLRSEESLAEKWKYVCENPVRAGLTSKPDDWPYAGSIDFV